MSYIWRKWKAIPAQKRLSWIMGAGLVMFTAHNVDLPWYNPETGVAYFLTFPQIGFILILWGTGMYLADIKPFPKWRELVGPKWAWIPMLIIIVSVIARSLIDGQYTGALFIISMGLVYIAARRMGRECVKPFAWALAVESSIIIFQAIAHIGVRTGGFYGGYAEGLPGNYAMATRLLMVAFLVGLRPKWQAIVGGLVITAQLLTGAEEGLFIMAVLFIVMLIRRDWSKRLAVAIAIPAVVMSILLVWHVPQELYARTPGMINSALAGVGITNIASVEVDKTNTELLDDGLGHRLTVWRGVIDNIEPLGHGYYVTAFGDSTFHVPHNVVLCITSQVGPIAALAWLCIIVVALWKTPYKYICIALLAGGVFDHALWTQAAPWWWAIIGLATTAKGSDKIWSRSVWDVKEGLK